MSVNNPQSERSEVTAVRPWNEIFGNEVIVAHDQEKVKVTTKLKDGACSGGQEIGLTLGEEKVTRDGVLRKVELMTVDGKVFPLDTIPFSINVGAYKASHEVVDPENLGQLGKNEIKQMLLGSKAKTYNLYSEVQISRLQVGDDLAAILHEIGHIYGLRHQDEIANDKLLYENEQGRQQWINQKLKTVIERIRLGKHRYEDKLFGENDMNIETEAWVIGEKMIEKLRERGVDLFPKDPDLVRFQSYAELCLETYVRKRTRVLRVDPQKGWPLHKGQEHIKNIDFKMEA